MKIAWSPRSIRNLAAHLRRIERESGQNAQLVAGRIAKSVFLLETQPEMGRPGRVSGTRELVVPDTPYLIPYRVRRDRLQLIAVLDGHREWPTKM